MSSPLVSICLPVYNAAPYILTTLHSLVNQTYPNIEIIISDNASTDGTWDLITDFAKKYVSVRFHKNDTNYGYVNNIRQAVTSAKSEFVAIFHADDLYEPTIIEKEFALLSQDSTFAGVFSRHREFWGTKHTYRDFPVYKVLRKTNAYDEQRKIFRGDKSVFFPLLARYNNYFFACPSFMTRKSVFLDCGGFTNQFPSCEDLDLWCRFLGRGHSLAVIDQVLLYYRRSDTQGAATWESSSSIHPMFAVLEHYIVKSGYPLEEDDTSAYYKQKSIGYIKAAYNAFINKNKYASRRNILLSKKSFTFTEFNRYTLAQHIPVLFFFLVLLKRTLIRMFRKVLHAIN